MRWYANFNDVAHKGKIIDSTCKTTTSLISALSANRLIQMGMNQVVFKKNDAKNNQLIESDKKYFLAKKKRLIVSGVEHTSKYFITNG